MNLEQAARDLEAAIKQAKKLRPGGRILVAIDGRCASGKTALAESLKNKTGCTVFHMDDYFLRPEQRTPERFKTPGGNVDRERFFSELLAPLKSGKEEVEFRKYDCRTGKLLPAVRVVPGDTVVIEGSYSCHPDLAGEYDIKVFLTVGKDEQARRIEKRNGRSAAAIFQTKWIPLEEEYFRAFGIGPKSDMVFELN